MGGNELRIGTLAATALMIASVGCERARKPETVEGSAASSSAGAEVEPARRVDGLDLIMTPEQRYFREYGNCEFRDTKTPSPFDLKQVTATRVVMDVREGGNVVGVEQKANGPYYGDMSQLVARLKKLASQLRRCGPLEPVEQSALNTGNSIAITFTPVTCFATPGMDVQHDVNEKVSRCLVSVLSSDLQGVEIASELNVAFIGFRVEGGTVLPPQPVDKDSIRRTINANMSDVVGCYEPALAIWPQLRGTVTVRFAISTIDGAVIDAEVAGDETRNRALACCVARKVYGWRFEATGQKGFTIVTYSC
jgi:hypothetical protein